MPADNISKTILQYKELVQLQEYASAQEKTILQMSKKLQKLEDEKKHLESLLESSVPLMKDGETKALEKLHGNQTESICHNEIRKLKDASMERELTYEECRKLDTYFKILTQISNFAKPIETEAKQMTDEQLLKIVGSNDDGN